MSASKERMSLYVEAETARYLRHNAPSGKAVGSVVDSLIQFKRHTEMKRQETERIEKMSQDVADIKAVIMRLREMNSVE